MLLHDLQRRFQERILSRKSGIEPVFNGIQDDDFDARLDTYVGGYRTRLAEALEATYPVLKTTLGANVFSREMRLYLEARPSRYFSVRHYGADVADYLAQRYRTPRGASLADLARWEWLLADVFDAADDDALTVAALAAVAPADWPGLTFIFRTCMRRFATSTNAVECWRAANGLRAKPRRLGAARPSHWLLWRRGTTTHFRSTTVLEADALNLASAGMSFAAICERVAQSVPASEAALRAASLLRTWIGEELIVDVGAAR